MWGRSRLGVALWCAFAFGACGGQSESLDIYKYTVPSVARLVDDRFAIVIEHVQSAVGATNYIVDVTIENISLTDQNFTVASLEVLDRSTGLTHPPLRPNEGMQASLGMLSDAPIKAGRKIEGRIYFQTKPGHARAPVLDLHFGAGTVTLTSAGRMSDEEIDARNP